MKTKLGSELSPASQRLALAAFVHRFTKEHKPAWALQPWKEGNPYPVQFENDQDWLAHTRFHVNKSGELSSLYNDCESSPTWPDNPELRRCGAPVLAVGGRVLIDAANDKFHGKLGEVMALGKDAASVLVDGQKRTTSYLLASLIPLVGPSFGPVVSAELVPGLVALEDFKLPPIIEGSAESGHKFPSLVIHSSGGDVIAVDLARNQEELEELTNGPYMGVEIVPVSMALDARKALEVVRDAESFICGFEDCAPEDGGAGVPELLARMRALMAGKRLEGGNEA